MTDKVYYSELECYADEKEPERRYSDDRNFYDLTMLPTETMREEYRRYLISRGKQVSMKTIIREKAYYKKLVGAMTAVRKTPKSFLCWDEERWIQITKMWMMKNGNPFYEPNISVYGTKSYRTASLIRYVRRLRRFLEPEDARPEQEKDIWHLDKLGIAIEENPIYQTDTLNFTKITQDGIREEVKKAVYLHLKYEKVGTVQTELTSLRRFSQYLNRAKPDIQSCTQIDRALLEEYLIHTSTNGSSGKSNSTSIMSLRRVLETIGKALGYKNLEGLFINTDIPPEVQPKFKAYSDAELKRLNAQITKLDVQITRCLVIHQMLGTRISDTLTLRRDCLKKQNGLDIIRIEQVKTHTYEKPISAELAALIHKAIDYTEEQYGETEYIFVDGQDTSKPLKYGTVKNKVLRLIQQEDLRDDDGNRFSFNTHMFRRSYGVKLTELHLDDWTIAKLLGHSNVNSVKHYRKMSNQLLADETRRAREEQTRILLENLDGWGEDYEQIRKDG